MNNIPEINIANQKVCDAVETTVAKDDKGNNIVNSQLAELSYSIPEIDQELILEQTEHSDELEKTSTSTEPHVFNPKLYKIIITKLDENLFANDKPRFSGLLETESGMYGRRLIISGIPITSSDHPKCIDLGRIPHKSICHICEFFSAVECPIQRDRVILDDAKTLFAQNARYRQENDERRQTIIETLFAELKEHGRPLHYEVIAKIMHDRHPSLKLNSWKIVRIMSWHPEKFSWVDVGVYQAK